MITANGLTATSSGSAEEPPLPWDLLLDAVSDLVLVFEAAPDAEPTCLAVSASWLAARGGRREDWVGRPASAILPRHSASRLGTSTARPASDEAFADVLPAGEGDVAVEVTLRTAVAGPAPGASRHVVWAARPTSARQQGEATLQQRNDELNRSNTDLSAFASLASHDLQEPLRMITSYLQLLERRCTDQLDEDALRYLGFAVDGAQRLRTMIESLLEYTRIRTSALETRPTDLQALVDNVRQELGGAIEDAGATLTTGDLPVVDVNPTLIQTLLQNLVGNAVKFSTGAPNVHIHAVVSDGTLSLTVDDDGIGVPADRREEVLELFRRLHGRSEYAGGGMGLALCRGIADAHGGHIAIEDSPMDGTRARVTLPAQLQGPSS